MEVIILFGFKTYYMAIVITVELAEVMTQRSIE